MVRKPIVSGSSSPSRLSTSTGAPDANYQTFIAGYYIPNYGAVLIHVKTGTRTGAFTIETPNSVDGNTAVDKAVSVHANQDRFVCALLIACYNNSVKDLHLKPTVGTNMMITAISLR
ncbi:MAG: hypothetical protein F4Z35_02325 [Dehalococcoidia bacterium]|nr:hypothetical protein [Dehalococcoidia bacterium]